MVKRVLVCQSRSCRKQGAIAVFKAFCDRSLVEFSIEAIACLGQCGNGPMVLIIPDEVWYDHVQVDEVAAIVEQHLLGGKPVLMMLYPKFHPH